ncbi:RNA-directed DNA polymerase [Listeria welshimeri]|nr:RNA-directed DNA polymerase [Listeria welshimeri]
MAIVGCYVSPNRSLADYELYLDGLADCVRRCLPRPLIVLGDFNAHARAWGNSRDDPKGVTLLDWAAGLDLRLINVGSESTCVRWQGESVVDLTWATPPAIRMLSGWRVAKEVVTLSDHRHIFFDVAIRHPDRSSRRQGDTLPRRWALKRLNRDHLEAAAIVAAWPQNAEEISPDPEGESVWFRGTMTSICDASMPRAGRFERRAMHWWSAEIAQLRTACLRAHRQASRTRRRRRATPEERDEAYRAFQEAKKALRDAISDAGARSWNELLEGLDRDPWGRPYRMVLGKLRPWMPPLTETLDPDLLRRVIDSLFPVIRSSPLYPSLPPVSWTDELRVTEQEFDRALGRLSARNTAPGPDGIPGRAWVLASAHLGDRLRRLFDSCLRNATFPKAWKEASLVLLRKDGRDADSPSAYRPICLLDEAGKLFERIVASRLSEHLSCVGPDLADSQFGFRQGRSTVDAIMRVRSLTEQAVSQGGVALAISLDIVNAFNALPWVAIREALVYHRVPPYLQAIVGSYLRDRYIVYVGQDGTRTRREVYCGVPQGSVLGPLLWNLAYDAVLRVELPAGVSVICYADDTLVLSCGLSFEMTRRRAELGVELVVAKICELGLRIAPHKTEALWFHKWPVGREPPHSQIIRVGDSNIQVSRYMKYLGLVLDGRWSFEEHFKLLVPRFEKAVGALHRLLPNLGGPREEVRRLYAGVVRSMALYGAPVWSHRLTGTRRCKTKILSLQRRVAIRMVRGCHTISFEAATLLACFPPLDILAERDSRIYDQTYALR